MILILTPYKISIFEKLNTTFYKFFKDHWLNNYCNNHVLTLPKNSIENDI